MKKIIKTKNLRIIITCIILSYIFLQGIKHITNQKWYDFKYQLKNEYPIIKNMSLTDYGPHCTIIIYLNKDNVDFNIVEGIFEHVLSEMNEPFFMDYLTKHHEKKASGEMVFLHIIFKYKNEKHEIMYKFETECMDDDNRFEYWGVDISPMEYLDNKYKLSDY